MSYAEQRISDLIDGGLLQNQQLESMKIRSINPKQHDVQAFLDKRKTQHRIPIKPQPEMIIMSERATESLKALIPNESNLQWGYKGCGVLPWPSGMMLYSKIRPGDILYVRETWTYTQYAFAGRGVERGIIDSIIYKADNNDDWDGGWRPSTTMPKAAARIWLRVKDVRVERLQDISEDDAVAEGIERVVDNSPFNNPDAWLDYMHPDDSMPFSEPQYSYATLIDSMYGLGTWDANPWVWVYDLEQIEKPQN